MANSLFFKGTTLNPFLKHITLVGLLTIFVWAGGGYSLITSGVGLVLYPMALMALGSCFTVLLERAVDWASAGPEHEARERMIDQLIMENTGLKGAVKIATDIANGVADGDIVTDADAIKNLKERTVRELNP